MPIAGVTLALAVALVLALATGADALLFLVGSESLFGILVVGAATAVEDEAVDAD